MKTATRKPLLWMPALPDTPGLLYSPLVLQATTKTALLCCPAPLRCLLGALQHLHEVEVTHRCTVRELAGLSSAPPLGPADMDVGLEEELDMYRTIYEYPGEEEGEYQAELAAATMPGMGSMVVSPAGATSAHHVRAMRWRHVAASCHPPLSLCQPDRHFRDSPCLARRQLGWQPRAARMPRHRHCHRQLTRRHRSSRLKWLRPPTSMRTRSRAAGNSCGACTK